MAKVHVDDIIVQHGKSTSSSEISQCKVVVFQYRNSTTIPHNNSVGDTAIDGMKL